jgi:hypothetical protein
VQGDEAKWSKFRTRAIASLGMSGFFLFITYLGHTAFSVFIFVLQVMSFTEVIKIGYIAAGEAGGRLKGFRVLNWYFLAVLIYTLYARCVAGAFGCTYTYLCV